MSDKNDYGLDQKHQIFIRNKVQQLGSLDAVKKLYNTNSAVDKYAFNLAFEIFSQSIDQYKELSNNKTGHDSDKNRKYENKVKTGYQNDYIQNNNYSRNTMDAESFIKIFDNKYGKKKSSENHQKDKSSYKASISSNRQLNKKVNKTYSKRQSFKDYKDVKVNEFKIINELICNPGYISKLELAWLKAINSPSNQRSSKKLLDQQRRELIKIYKIYMRDKELLDKYGKFYHELDSGERTPKTKAEKHFVLVCQGHEKPNTEHEIAYLKSKSAFYKDFQKKIPVSINMNRINERSSNSNIQNEPRKVMYNSWFGLKRHKSNWW